MRSPACIRPNAAFGWPASSSTPVAVEPGTITVESFRSGTLREALPHTEPPTTERAATASVQAMLAEVSGHLGTTPTVARNSYTAPAGLHVPRSMGYRASRGKETAMPRGSSKKRERQYEHIKEGLKERGRSEDTAEEIAARTVNKERARAGESKQKSRTSTEDISSSRRGGLRSHSGSQGRTKEQLYNEAKNKNVKGRSKMSKAQLEKAVGR
jgi:hypothetical protein